MSHNSDVWLSCRCCMTGALLSLPLFPPPERENACRPLRTPSTTVQKTPTLNVIRISMSAKPNAIESASSTATATLGHQPAAEAAVAAQPTSGVLCSYPPGCARACR
eukprot:scaffold4992_cov101-Isochrysis_galbana.AAC.2